MMSDLTDRGAQRRALVRVALGKPGSLRRWAVGTTIWLLACLTLSFRIEWLGRIFIFIFAVALPLLAFRTRSLATGDEDEFHAAVRRERAAALHSPVVEDNEDRLDPADWFAPHGLPLDGAPPPPALDDEQADGTDR